MLNCKICTHYKPFKTTVIEYDKATSRIVGRCLRLPGFEPVEEFSCIYSEPITTPIEEIESDMAMVKRLLGEDAIYWHEKIDSLVEKVRNVV